MKTIARLGVGVAVAVTVAVSAAPAVAASPTTVSGTGVLDPVPGGTCAPMAGFESFPPIVMSGDLQGCLYSQADRKWDLGAPSGLYFEAGHELFVGHVHGGPFGSFRATYTVESQYDPDVSSGNEVWGACQHQIVPGSGQLGLRGVTGHFRFNDVVSDGALVRYQVKGAVRRP